MLVENFKLVKTMHRKRKKATIRGLFQSRFSGHNFMNTCKNKKGKNTSLFALSSKQRKSISREKECNPSAQCIRIKEHRQGETKGL